MTRRVAATVVLIIAAMTMGFQTGCTPTRSAQENKQRLAQQVYWESRMLVEDVQLFLQIEHPTRLSRWHYIE